MPSFVACNFDRKRHQVQHHFGVFIEGIRHVHRAIRQLDGMRGLRLRILDALLDFADRIHILAELGAVAASQRFGQEVHFFGDRIENASGISDPRQSLSCTAAVTK